MTSLSRIKVQGRIVIAARRLRLRELLQLERGSVVPLNGNADSPSELHVNGVAVARGHVRIAGERTRFQIHDRGA